MHVSHVMQFRNAFRVQILNQPFKQPGGTLLRGYRTLAEHKDEGSVFDESKVKVNI